MEPPYRVERDVVGHHFADDDTEDGVLRSCYALHELVQPRGRVTEIQTASVALAIGEPNRLVGDFPLGPRLTVTYHNLYGRVGVTTEQPVDPRDRQLPGRVGCADRQDVLVGSGLRAGSRASCQQEGGCDDLGACDPHAHPVTLLPGASVPRTRIRIRPGRIVETVALHKAAVWTGWIQAAGRPPQTATASAVALSRRTGLPR